jgi:hypothetical protein
MKSAGPQRDREGASARNQKTCKQHETATRISAPGTSMPVHVQRDADRRGNDEQCRQYEIEPADADGHADRQQGRRGDRVRSPDARDQRGTLDESRGSPAAHHMMGGGRLRHKEKRDHDQRRAAQQT